MSAHSQDIIANACAAMNAFREALSSTTPVMPTAIGLDYLCRATALATDPAPLSRDPEAARVLSRLMLILADAGTSIPDDQIVLGLSSAHTLLIAAPDEFYIDRLLHAGKLAAALRGWLCDAELQQRGNPLMRAVRIRQAMTALPTPGMLLH